MVVTDLFAQAYIIMIYEKGEPIDTVIQRGYRIRYILPELRKFAISTQWTAATALNLLRKYIVQS